MIRVSKFAQEAASHLVGTPWEALDAFGYNSMATDQIRKAKELGGPLPAQLATPPPNPSMEEAKKCVKSTLSELYFLDQLVMAIGDNEPLMRGITLNVFWPEGSKMPVDTPLPQAFVDRALIELYRSLYPLLRKVNVAYVDPVRGKAWGAWCPSEASSTAPMPGKDAIERTVMFENYHWKLAQQMIFLLTSAMDAPCRPFFRRLAEDTVFLDAVALTLVSTPIVREAFLGSRDMISWTPEKRKDLSVLEMGPAVTC